MAAAFEGGANFDTVSFDGARHGRYDFRVEWSLEVEGPPGAKVTVCDRVGEQVFAESISDTGRLIVPPPQFLQTPEARTVCPPYAVTVEGNSKDTTRQVTLDCPKTLDFGELKH